MSKLRLTENKDEIAYYFKGYIQKATNILVWQNVGNKRKVWIGRILFINSKNKKAFISIRRDKLKEFNPDVESTLYVKGDYESVLFKTKIQKTQKQCLEIDIPDCAYLYEKRKYERFQFQSETNQLVSFAKSSDYEKSRDLLNGNVLDVSRQGLTLIIQPNMAQNWSTNDFLNIYRISNKKFSTPLKAKIIYIKPIRKIKNNRMSLKYRFGLQFQEEINRLQMDTIAIESPKIEVA